MFAATAITRAIIQLSNLGSPSGPKKKLLKISDALDSFFGSSFSS
jgi:hypothetical protein